jgi:hypothetical protein
MTKIKNGMTIAFAEIDAWLRLHGQDFGAVAA